MAIRDPGASKDSGIFETIRKTPDIVNYILLIENVLAVDSVVFWGWIIIT
jgi:hypothetical protein